MSNRIGKQSSKGSINANAPTSLPTLLIVSKGFNQSVVSFGNSINQHLIKSYANSEKEIVIKNSLWDLLCGSAFTLLELIIDYLRDFVSIYICV